MEILVIVIALIIIFFVYQTKKTVSINKTSFSPFPIWLKKYISTPYSIDKATIAKSVMLQALVISKELGAIKSEHHQELSLLFNSLQAEESIKFVNGYIEEFLPRLEGVVNQHIIETSSARYVFMLMIIAAISLNPRGSISDFFEKPQSNRRI